MGRRRQDSHGFHNTHRELTAASQTGKGRQCSPWFIVQHRADWALALNRDAIGRMWRALCVGRICFADCTVGSLLLFEVILPRVTEGFLLNIQQSTNMTPLGACMIADMSARNLGPASQVGHFPSANQRLAVRPAPRPCCLPQDWSPPPRQENRPTLR